MMGKNTISEILEMEPIEGTGVQVITDDSIERYQWLKNSSHEKELVVNLNGFLHSIAPEKMISLSI